MSKNGRNLQPQKSPTSSNNGKTFSPKDQSKTQTLIASITESWEAPLPHPSILAQYEELVPGSAAKIIESVHAQNAIALKLQDDQNLHRIEMEKTFLLGNEQRIALGQKAAICFTTLLIGLAFTLAFLGFPTEAAALAGGIVASGGLIFILGGHTPKPK
jgi:uncharacterized membrane protein